MIAQFILSAVAEAAVPAADAVKDSGAETMLVTNQTFALLLVGGIAFATFMALLMLNHYVATADGWSLAEALSEEAEIGTEKKDTAGNPVRDNHGNIAKDSVMKASSSRLIALLGTISILMLYIGGGLIVLYQFALKQEVPEHTKELSTFFLNGMVLFAPYIVNKFASIFGWLK